MFPTANRPVSFYCYRIDFSPFENKIQDWITFYGEKLSAKFSQTVHEPKANREINATGKVLHEKFRQELFHVMGKYFQ